MNIEQIKVVSTALDYPDELSVFEYDFVNDLADEYEDRALSEKQIRILDKINDKLENAGVL